MRSRTLYAPTATSDSKVSMADELFASLDGQMLDTDDSGEWEIRVAGIHFEDEHCWAQVRLTGHEDYLTTVCVDAATPQAILYAVRVSLATRVGAQVIPGVLDSAL